MDIVKAVAKVRLGYHLNMIDVCNVANQLHLLSNKRADRCNENHLRQCLDCYSRLGYRLPVEMMEFKNK